MTLIHIDAHDDRYTVRAKVRQAVETPVVLVLPWENAADWTNPLAYEVIQREIQQRNLNAAWVIADPAQRTLARAVGFPAYASKEAADTYLSEHGTFPGLKLPKAKQAPKQSWWQPTPKRPRYTMLKRQPAWLITLEVLVFLATLAALTFAAYLAVPRATITLYPANIAVTRIAQISVDPELTQIDLVRGVIPATRIGDEFEGVAEVATSGRGFSYSGLATGRVLFTNLLGQDYRVPAGTIVRTSSGSYPVRFVTTGEVTLPAFGQAEASVEALEDGPASNVGAYQINLIEGVVGFAARVTNPNPVTGAESTTVAVVSEEDRARAWDLAARQALANAISGLQDLAAEEPGRFMPQQTLVVQAAPKIAYTHLVGEESDRLGVTIRLLITGYAVSIRDAQTVAYHQLSANLPEGYTLNDAEFEYGEAAEENIGPGIFTFFVTARGNAAADIDTAIVFPMIHGKSTADATAALEQAMQLRQPPDIDIWPESFPYLPQLEARTSITVIPGSMAE